MKAHGRHVSNGSVHPALIAGADHMGAILDKYQIMFSAVGKQSVQFHRLTRKVNCYYGLCSLCCQLLHMCRIYVIGIFIDICKDRLCPTVQCTVCRGGKGNRCSDHFISRHNSGCQTGNMKCRCPIAAYNCIFCSRYFTQLFFQFPDLGTTGQIITFQHIYNCLDIILINKLVSIKYFCTADRFPSADCRFLHIHCLLLFYDVCRNLASLIAGNVTVISVPSPGSLFSAISAFNFNRICLTIASPRPVPPVDLLLLLSTR